VYEPAEMPFVSVTIPVYLSPTDVAITLKGVLVGVSKRHNDDSTSDIELTLEAETHGLAADYVAVPAGNTTVYVPPYVPSGTDTLPPLSVGDITIPSSVFPTDPVSTAPSVVPGRAAIYNTATAAYRTYDIRPSAPTWDDVGAPSWFTTISMMVMDEGKAFSRGAYILGNDGTDSRVAYTTDVFETVPVWTLQPVISGLFSIIKSVRGIPGAIFVAGSATAPSSTTTRLDLTISNYGGTVPAASGTAIHGYGSFGGTGLHSSTIANGSGSYFAAAGGMAGYNHVSSVNIHTTLSVQSNEISISDALGNNKNNFGLNNPDSEGVDGTGYYMQFNTSDWNFSTFDIYLSHTAQFSVDWIDLTHSTPPSGNVSSRYSTDGGATFGSAQIVDPLTGYPGFDAGPRGIAALAGGDQRVRTSLAGTAYANTVNGGASGSYPISVCVPDYQIGSISKTNKPDDPHFLFAAPALIASHALWKVTLAGKNGITPSVSGNAGLGVSPLGLDAWKGKRFMYIGDASGTRYLFVTKDTGVTWTYTAMAAVESVRIRRYSTNGYEAIAAGINELKYTANGGVSWSTKTASGSNLFAQIFG